MLVLNDAGIRRFPVRIVDNRIALPVVTSDSLILKTQAPVLQMTEREIEILIKSTGIKHIACNASVVIPVFVEITGKLNITAFKHLLCYLRIATFRYPLIRVIEVIIVISVAYRQSSDYFRRQLAAVPSPLFLSIALYKFVEDITADK